MAEPESEYDFSPLYEARKKLTEVPDGQEALLEYVSAVREAMGLPPVLEFSNALKDGASCHSLYLPSMMESPG